MTAKLVMLVLATVSLAACATASTDDLSVHRNASPTKGDLGSHRVVIKSPIVPDSVAPTRTAAVRHAPAHRATASRATTSRATTPRVVAAKPAPSRSGMREVPNPLRQAPPAQAAATPAPDVSGLPTEPVQPTSAEQSWAQPETPPTTTAEVPIQEPATQPEPSGTSLPPLSALPAMLGLGNITIDSIEQTFGGMPFWLISVIAAALVATLGLAMRRSRPKEEEEYEEPRVDDPEEDYREPYAA